MGNTCTTASSDIVGANTVCPKCNGLAFELGGKKSKFECMTCGRRGVLTEKATTDKTPTSASWTIPGGTAAPMQVQKSTAICRRPSYI